MVLDELVQESDPRSSESSSHFLDKTGTNRWENQKLGDIIDLVYGSGLSKEVRTPGGYPVYGSNGIVGYHEKSLVEGPGIIVGRKGSIGKVIWCNEDFWPIDTTYYIERKTHLDLKWIYYKLLSLNLEKLNSATGIPGLNRCDVFSLNVKVPTILEQRKIAAILSSVDAAIEDTVAIISKLKEIKSNLFSDLISRGIDENGMLRDPIVHPEQFKKVLSFGLIPVEWSAPSIGSIAVHVGSGITPKGGSKVYKNEGVVFIRSQNVTFDGLLLDGVAHIDFEMHKEMKRSEVFAYDVLLNITGASIGRCCPLPEGVAPANVNQHVCAIRLPDPSREDAILLSSILASNIGQSQIDLFNAGGNREGLNYEQLRSFIIPWPSQKERRRIALVIDSQNARIRVEEEYLDKLKRLKNGLMQDLLTGRVPVKVDGHA